MVQNNYGVIACIYITVWCNKSPKFSKTVEFNNEKVINSFAADRLFAKKEGGIAQFIISSFYSKFLVHYAAIPFVKCKLYVGEIMSKVLST